LNAPSFEFLAFAAAIALLIHVSNAPGWRRAILVLANVALVLSFTHDPKQLAPFAVLLAFGFVSMKAMESYRSRAAFIPLVVGLLFAFFWLKRYAFVPHYLYLPFTYLTIGMSYVFFRILHLVIDAYHDALPERLSIAAYASYTLNFTCLISGPIQLYQDYRRTETEEPLRLNVELAGKAASRIVAGFFKVSVLSPVLLYAQQQCIALLGTQLTFSDRVVDAGVALALFPIYLYFNFAGYTDFVIGVAGFLGLQLPENFNKPFLAGGVIDFWTRWHMTLSNWLKTYVYLPLLLSSMRRFPAAKTQAYLGVFAYFVTFFLVGAWHGQSAKFLFFGLLTGLGISVNKWYEFVMTQRLGRVGYRDLGAQPAYAALARAMNFTWFCITMLWFWSNWQQLGGFAALLGTPAIILAILGTLIAAVFVLSALKSLGWVERLNVQPLRAAWYTALAVITVSVAVALNAPAPHVVYRAF
jgi:D-alanyl-lipoteichoic acid acyltransferase DltB (MBOAT superfamily)